MSSSEAKPWDKSETKPWDKSMTKSETKPWDKSMTKSETKRLDTLALAAFNRHDLVEFNRLKRLIEDRYNYEDNVTNVDAVLRDHSYLKTVLGLSKVFWERDHHLNPELFDEAITLIAARTLPIADLVLFETLASHVTPRHAIRVHVARVLGSGHAKEFYEELARL